MKALVLIGNYTGEPGYDVLRAYTDAERKLAEKDLDMVIKADSNGSGKEWRLIECEFISDL